MTNKRGDFGMGENCESRMIYKFDLGGFNEFCSIYKQNSKIRVTSRI